MGKASTILAVVIGLSAGPAVADATGYVHFSELAERVLAGDSQAFREVLALSRSTAPGEQLEELAEISSRYVRVSPAEFLRGQVGSATCFGVSFMGPGYVDNSEAKVAEVALRKAALEAVEDPSLADAKRVCLLRLGGG